MSLVAEISRPHGVRLRLLDPWILEKRFLVSGLTGLLVGVLLQGAAGCGAGESSYVPGPKPTSLPKFSEIGLYSADAPVNLALDGSETLDPNSASYVAGIVSAAAEAGGLIFGWRQYSSPIYFADADTPKTSVELPCGSRWDIGVSRLLEVPIPDHAEPSNDMDGRNRPVPKNGCGEHSNQDNHMIVIDRVAGCEYDFWQARNVDGKWVASWGNGISLSSKGIYPNGLSTRGSGFAFTGGVIWPDELAAGQIDHALVFSYPRTSAAGPVAPATESDGWSKASDALPEGAHLRLDPSVDLNSLGLGPVELAVGKAMQTYGMYLVDDGGGVQIYGVDPRSVATNPYGTLLPDDDYPVLGNLPLDKLQLLTLPTVDSTWRDQLSVASTGCNHFE